MWSDLLVYALIGLMLLVALGMALLPLALWSGLWAHMQGTEQRAHAAGIKRLLNRR
ncbi:hypothetical protein [Hydrogenophaga sp.]|uniref:hypothetical protein n=1 Tax=Hydrogenophaga sp. TaxID=1904254 RepID=UPI003F712718